MAFYGPSGGGSGGGGGTIINPTDGVIPFRVSALAFGDSPLNRVSTTVVSVGVTGPIFGTDVNGSLISSPSGFAMTIGGSAANSPLNFRTMAVNRWSIIDAGHLIAVADNTYDIGGAGVNRPRNLYLAGSLVATGATLTGLTPGSVLFAGAGGVIGQDAPNLFWDDVNNILHLSQQIIGIGDSSGLTDLLINPPVKTSGNLFNAQVGGVNKFTVDFAGKVLAGVWNGTVVTTPFGGTGLSAYSAGQLLYGSTGTALGVLATQPTTNVLLSGGVNAPPLWGKVDLSTMVVGVLPPGNGGTGVTTNFTQGSVPFAGPSGALIENNASFFFNNTGVRLGIGTNAPLQRLHLSQAAVDGMGIQIENTAASGGNKSLLLAQAGPTGFGTSGWENAGAVESQGDGGLVLSAYSGLAAGIQFITNLRTLRMRIHGDTGNVGIGGSATTRLGIQVPATIGTIVTGLRIWNPSSGINAGTRLTLGWTDGDTFGASIVGYFDNVGTTAALGIETAGTRRLTVRGDGNVGIGNVDPLTLLHLQKSDADGVALRIEDPAVPGTYKHLTFGQFGPTATGVASWVNAAVLEGAAVGGLVLSAYAADLRFQTNLRTTRMTIANASGNVGIGTTTPGTLFGGLVGGGIILHVANPTNNAQLWISAGASSLPTITMENTNATLGRRAFQMRYDGSLNAFKSYFFDEANGTATQDNVLVLKNTGNVGVGVANPGFNLSGSGSATGTVLQVGNSTNRAGVLISASNIPNLTLESLGATAGRRVFFWAYLGTSNLVKCLFSDENSGVTVQDNVLVLSNTGNVGIGVVPSARLHMVSPDSSAVTDFLVNPTTKTSGNLLDLQVGGVSKFAVGFGGNVFTVDMSCRVQFSANQNIPGTGAIVSWTVENSDPVGMHDPAVNPSRITVPAAGRYLLTTVIFFSGASPTGWRSVWFLQNNAGLAYTQMGAASSGSTVMTHSTVAVAAAGDFFEVFVNSSVAGGIDIFGTTSAGQGVGAPYFMVTKIN